MIEDLILLMEDQDRSRWDRRLIERAQEFLDQSAEGTAVSIFHLEAGIAMYHCAAPSYSRDGLAGYFAALRCNAHDPSFAGLPRSIGRSSSPRSPDHSRAFTN